MSGKPILWIIIPCYNEEEVLPITAPQFLHKILDLTAQGPHQRQKPGLLCERRLQRPHLAADLPIRTAGPPLHRHQPKPQPGPTRTPCWPG